MIVRSGLIWNCIILWMLMTFFYHFIQVSVIFWYNIPSVWKCSSIHVASLILKAHPKTLLSDSTAPHLNAHEISVLLWRHLSGKSAAAKLMCEKPFKEKIQTQWFWRSLKSMSENVRKFTAIQPVSIPKHMVKLPPLISRCAFSLNITIWAC